MHPGTTVWTIAQLKLVGFLKDKHSNRQKPKAQMFFSDAAGSFRKRVQNASAMKESSYRYRGLYIRKNKSSLPDL